MDKKGKRLNKKEKASIEREELKAKLLEKYVEGESNIDRDQLSADEIWQLIPYSSSIEEKEKTLGRKLPLITKEEWLERELAKIESEKTKIPSHKVQDPEAKIYKYRQKFVEAAIEINPQIVADLKELVPYFKNLFGKENKKEYSDIFEDLKYELVDYWGCYPEYTDKIITDYKYLWGLVKDVFNLAFVKFMLSDLEGMAACPDNTSELVEEDKYSLESIDNAIKKAFQDSAVNQDLILNNFYQIQKNIYQWVEKYHLQKDWLVDYAYYFIHQFNQNPTLEAKNVEIGIRHYDYRRTKYYPFEFTAKGWWASEGGETANQYQIRVTKEFNEKLNQYIDIAASSMELNELPVATKPPTYKSLEWLAYSTVKGWNSERIAEKFFPDIAAKRTESEKAAKKFDNTKKHIENEIRKFKGEEYDLPMREDL